MKRKLTLLTIMAFIFFALSGAAQAQLFKEYSFKFSGGYGDIAVGDYNPLAESLNAQWNDTAALYGLSPEGEFDKQDIGYEYEGELTLSLSENFAIGIGGGYIKRHKISEVTVSAPGLSIEGVLDPKTTSYAIPVINAYYFLPVASSVNIFLTAGGAYYQSTTRTTYRIETQVLGADPVIERTEIECKKGSFGVHGAVGLDVDVLPNFSFFVEGRARYAKMPEWKSMLGGRFGLTAGAVLYSIEKFDETTGKWYKSVDLSVTEPTGSDIRNAEEFEVDLSGICLRLGIRIKFL